MGQAWGIPSALLCVTAGAPLGLDSSPCRWASLTGFLSPQLEDGALVTLLGLLWRRLPVPLCLLRLTRWGRQPGGHRGGGVRRPAWEAPCHPGLQSAALRSLDSGALGGVLCQLRCRGPEAERHLPQ